MTKAIVRMKTFEEMSKKLSGYEELQGKVFVVELLPGDMFFCLYKIKRHPYYSEYYFYEEEVELLQPTQLLKVLYDL